MRRLPILALPFLIFACNSQNEPKGSSQIHPSSIEEELIIRALGSTTSGNNACLTSTISPAEGNFWPDAFSFGDGKLSRSGDPRYDRVAQSWKDAKPLRANSIRMPEQATRQGFQLVGDGKSTPTCREVRTLHLPRFSEQFAFVIMDLRWSAMIGSRRDIQIYERRKNRWENFGSGSISLGVPVI